MWVINRYKMNKTFFKFNNEYYSKKWKKDFGQSFFNVILNKVTLNNEGKRVLIVVDKVPQEDLRQVKEKRYFLEKSVGEVLDNIVNHVNKSIPIKEYSVFNFHEFRTYKLPVSSQIKAYISFKERLFSYIEQYKPDIVVFMGNDSQHTIFNEKTLAKSLEDGSIQVNQYKYIGRIRKFKVKGKEYKSVGTIDINIVGVESYREEKLKSWPNLIGQCVEHMETAFRGYNLYDITKEPYTIKRIDTLKKFNKFYKRLLKAETPCFDTETLNLNRIANKVLTVQISLDGKVAYFLPLCHRQTPFLPKEIEYIRRKMRLYFEYGVSTYQIYHNAKFDLLVMKNEFNIRYFNHNLYDSIAGSMLLDENRKFLIDLGFMDNEVGYPYSLGVLARQYGCIDPKNEMFSYEVGNVNKQNRDKIDEQELDDVELYGSKDCIIPYRIHKCQLEEAKRRGKKYDKFLDIMLFQVSAMLQTFVTMENTGILVDKPYLLSLLPKNSIVSKELQKVNEKFKKSKYAIKTNDILVKERGIPQKTLFGTNTDTWLFNIAEQKTQQLLFFGVLNLDKQEERKDGGGKVDKIFQKHYFDVEEVAILTEYNKIKKLKSTYVDGLYRKLQESEDAAIDGRLRPEFSYSHIITGRAAASNPGFHQIPSRGSLSKIIKREFIAPKGFIIIKVDYSAHEVRNWCNVSKDEKLAESFRVGLVLRRKLRIAKNIHLVSKLKRLINNKGDVHILNYKFFFGQDLSKLSEESEERKDKRQSVKGVVFGAIYSIGANSLSESIKTTPKKAQYLINTLFNKFKKGGDYLKNTKEKARKTYIVKSAIGRVRHLWGYLHHDRSVKGSMDRRGPNSEIQGISSDEGFKGGRILQEIVWKLFEKHKKDYKFPLKQYLSVHDSNNSISSIVTLPISLYLLEHSLTTLVHKSYREEFGFSMLVDLEIEVEIGGSEDNLTKWDFRKDSLIKLAEDQIDYINKELKYNLDKEDIMKKVIHNANIIDKIRRREVKLALKSNKLAEKVLLLDNPKWCKQFILE